MSAVDRLIVKLAVTRVPRHIRVLPNGDRIWVKSHQRGTGQYQLFEPPKAQMPKGEWTYQEYGFKRLDLDRLMPDSLMRLIDREGIPVNVKVWKDAVFKARYPAYKNGINARALVDADDPKTDHIEIDIAESSLSYPILLGSLLHEVGHTIQNRRGDIPRPASNWAGSPVIVEYEADAWDVAWGLADWLGIEVNETMKKDAEESLGTYKATVKTASALDDLKRALDATKAFV